MEHSNGSKPFRSERPQKDGQAFAKKGGEKRPFEKKPGERKPAYKSGDGKLYEHKSGEHNPGDRPSFRGGKPSFPRKPSVGKPAPNVPTARDLALKALKGIALESAYAAQALDRELNAARLSDEDRRLAASLYYTALENRLRIEHVLMRFMSRRPEIELMEILTLAAAQLLFMDKIPDHAAVDEAVKQARRARFERQTGMVNGVLRSLIRARDAGEITLPDRESAPVEYLSEKYSVAQSLAERIAAAYGVDEAERILSWVPDRRTECIRPNQMQLRGAGFEAWMSQAGLDWEASPVRDAYRVKNAGRLASHEGYRKGFFSIQGEGSMLAAQAVQAQPGMQILDACAAPGGKTCLIAESMRGTGRVYAWDLHAHRVELIRAAAARLGLENIRTQARDAAKRNESLRGEMDAVLIDAPCSGLGVMAAKPDIKYRQSAESIAALAPIQREILNTCAGYVRPGGLLVYSTCTILPEENEAQVRAFLESHPDFEPDADDTWLPEPMRARFADGRIQILPSRDGMEGFFIARMRRKADAYGG